MADDAFAKEVRELLDYAEEADKTNREEALIDLGFEGFMQWNETVRNWREAQNPPLPCFTINVAQQYTALVVGDWLANEQSIRVLPREDGDVKIAQVRSELIRSIELQSKSERIYPQSLGQSASCGISNFRVDIDNAYEDAFVRDIFIRDIPDPLAVRWDPLAYDPTGRDATFCFVGDEITVKEYELRFPKAAKPSVLQKDCGSKWSDGKTVFLPEYWKIDERTRTLGMTATGATVDLTGMDRTKWPQLAIGDDGQPIINDKAKCRYAVMTMTNGAEQLADPFELKLHRIPIIRVMGREVITEEGRVRFGLIRGLRDSQRFRNYLRSVRAELLIRAPRNNYIAPASSVKGREGDWDNTLVYNDGAQKPEEVTARNLAALLNEEQVFVQDMMDTTGIHEASRGMPSNETSGVAIARRQQEGDIATLIYHNNMSAAQQEAGEIINALIPIVYDTPRTIRTVGPDMTAKMIRVNDPEHPDSIDIGLGRYDTVISTGPRYQTRRQEASASMLELIRAKPDLADIIGDLFMQAQDVPEADEMAKRVKRAIPPQILGDDADDGKSPEEIAQQQQQAQEAQAEQAQMKALAMRKAVAEAEEAEARAKKALADAEAALRKPEIDGYNAETNRIKAVTTQFFPLPPEAEAILAPIVTQAVANVLASPDVLPLAAQIDIAASHLARADKADAAEDAAKAAALQQPPEQQPGVQP